MSWSVVRIRRSARASSRAIPNPMAPPTRAPSTPRDTRDCGALEALLLDGDALRFLERGEDELALILLERVVLLEGDAVLPGECVELGPGDRVLGGLAVGIVRRQQHGPFDVADLLLERVEAGEGGAHLVLAELFLAFGEVGDEFVGERVGDGDGVVLGLLGGGDLQRPGLGVGEHLHLAGERRGRPVVVERFGGAGGDLAGGGEQRELVERLRVVESAAGGVGHEQRVGGVPRGDRVGRLLRRRQARHHRARDREDHHDPPEPAERIEGADAVHADRNASSPHVPRGGNATSRGGSQYRALRGPVTDVAPSAGAPAVHRSAQATVNATRAPPSISV